MNAPEKCPRCGADYHRIVHIPASHTNKKGALVVSSKDVREFTCHTGVAEGAVLYQSPNCVVAERDALRAELAALKAENERLTTNAFNLSSLIEEVAEKAGILSDGMPANDDATERLEIRGDGWSIEGMQGLLVEYVAALKAERAGMVTREVAERLGEIALSAGVGLGSGKVEMSLVESDEYNANWAGFAAKYARPMRPVAKIVSACLARAEAEAAKPQTDKEKSDG